MEIETLYRRIEEEITNHVRRFGEMPKIIVMNPNTCKALFETISGRKV